MEVKVGTIETVTEDDAKKKTRQSRHVSGGNGGNGRGRKNGGGGGGGNDGHDDGDDRPDSEERAAEASTQKYRISMWALVVVASMTFMGLSAAYIMLASNPQL